MASGKRKKGKGKARRRATSASDASSVTNSKGPQSEDDAIAALLEQARSAVDPFVAITLYEKALQARPDDTSIMGDAAELMLQLGQTEQAKEVLARSISLRPDEGPDKYLYMAQLHEGRQALAFYEKGLGLLQKQFEDAEAGAKENTETLKQRLCLAYCSVGELFLTDLCFEEGAEQRCQDALDRSMAYDYGGPEPLHALANLCLSQSRPKDAVSSAEEAFQRLGLCEPPPDQEFRVSLAKILMECSAVEKKCCEKALDVLNGLMQEDDENVELWYLMAVAFNGLDPPDYENARVHLNTASEMLQKIRTAQEEAGEEFSFQQQVDLIDDQLKVAARAAEDDMEGEASSDKLHAPDEARASNGNDEMKMDCG